MRSPGEDISLTLKREFGEETMNSLEAEPHIKEKIAHQVSELFKHGCKVVYVCQCVCVYVCGVEDLYVDVHKLRLLILFSYLTTICFRALSIGS